MWRDWSFGHDDVSTVECRRPLRPGGNAERAGPERYRRFRPSRGFLVAKLGVYLVNALDSGGRKIQMVSCCASVRFVGVGGRPPPGGIVDLPCALANALFRPLSRHFSPLAELSDELAARHEAIVRAAEPEVAQLSFSCIYAWLSTAASAAERLGRLGQVQ